MSTTSITLTRQTVEQMIPATFDKNKGFFSLVTVNWTEQMFYELPTITVELYIKNGTTDIKTPLFSRVIKTYNPNTKIKESWEHTRNVIDVPESCYLKIIPNFDNNAVSARNSLIENGIEEGELWETPTTQFPIILSIGEEASGTEQTIEGQPPISFISTTTSLIDWTLYGNSIQNGTPTPTSPKPVLGCGDYYETEPELKNLTGVPPFTINTDGTSIETWSIDGNSQQNGTPTPDNPIMPEFVGERTENLFDAGIEHGSFNGNTGEETSATTRIRSVFSQPMNPGTYTINCLGADDAVVYVYNSNDISSFEKSESLTVWTSMPVTFSISEIRYVRFAFRKSNNSAISPSDISNITLNTGTTAKPYEPYGYKLTITSANQTTPVYLGQVQTVRRIQKIEFDGSENWNRQSVNDYGIANFQLAIPDRLQGTAETMLSSHFVRQTTSIGTTQGMGFYIGGGAGKLLYLRCDSSIGTDLSDFQAWLAAQKANGTPVSFWYILETPETAIVNEPLAKIGEYADTLTSEQAGITLPTIKGTTTVTADTTLLPSNMSITYYEQFQKYIIPITNRSNTQTIDLSAVQSNRKIKKLVLTGDEGWTKPVQPVRSPAHISLKGYLDTENIIICKCSHYNCIGNVQSSVVYSDFPDRSVSCLAGYSSNGYLYISDYSNMTSTENTIAYLRDQYNTGTPVTIYYVLADEVTKAENEPLQKIGTYSDNITKDQSGITIPVEKGLNTIEVETEVPPSNVEITYR